MIGKSGTCVFNVMVEINVSLKQTILLLVVLQLILILFVFRTF